MIRLWRARSRDADDTGVEAIRYHGESVDERRRPASGIGLSKVAQHTKDMTPDQLESYGIAEFAKLEKAFGATLDEKLQAAAEMIHDLDLKQPGLNTKATDRALQGQADRLCRLVTEPEVLPALTCQ